MAQTGYTPILIYSSSTAAAAPAAGSLTNSTLGSELAINITDGKLFYKDNANAVQVIGWKVVPTSAGGTGLTSYTAGDLIYYASGTTFTKLAIGSSNQILTSTGSAPQWSSAITVTGLTNSGNLTFTGTGNRITGDFTNATIANRVLFQTSTANSSTGVFAIPSGTGNTAGFGSFNNSDPANAAFGSLTINGSTDVRLTSGITGTGTYLPMTFYVSGAEAMRIAADGTVTLAATSGLSIGRTGVTAPAATDGNVFSGTYTPAQVSTNTNVDSVTFVSAHYMRVGNVVTVGGQITIDATTATSDTVVRMSIPIASNFANSRELGGVGSSFSTPYASNSITFSADTTNDCAELRLRPSVNTALIYNFSFTYRII